MKPIANTTSPSAASVVLRLLGENSVAAVSGLSWAVWQHLWYVSIVMRSHIDGVYCCGYSLAS